MATRNGAARRQLELHMPTWGGRRKGAGRKRVAERPSVPHAVRDEISRSHPLHVTIRMRDDVPDLRQRTAWAAIVRVLREFRGMYALAFVHYVVLGNHLHFIAEAEDRASLAAGMQELGKMLARAINGRFDRKGSVLASRYHVRELTTPLAVKHALRYVLLNAVHHGASSIDVGDDWIDHRSTAAIFDGWKDPPNIPQRFADFGTSPARTWLLRVGWKRHGLLDRP